jgi:hypothetical protein
MIGMKGKNGPDGKKGLSGANGLPGSNQQTSRLNDLQFPGLYPIPGDKLDNARMFAGHAHTARRQSALEALLVKPAYRLLESELKYVEELVGENNLLLSSPLLTAWVNQAAVLLDRENANLFPVPPHMASFVQTLRPLRGVSPTSSKNATLSALRHFSEGVREARSASVQLARQRCGHFFESMVFPKALAIELMDVPACNDVEADTLVLSEDQAVFKDIDEAVVTRLSKQDKNPEPVGTLRITEINEAEGKSKIRTGEGLKSTGSDELSFRLPPEAKLVLHPPAARPEILKARLGQIFRLLSIVKHP